MILMSNIEKNKIVEYLNDKYMIIKIVKKKRRGISKNYKDEIESF